VRKKLGSENFGKFVCPEICLDIVTRFMQESVS
jgi:hypothetical protein